MDENIRLVNGRYVDDLIEQVLAAIGYQDWDAPELGPAYTLIVQRYISGDCPNLAAGHAGKDRVGVGALHYMHLLQIDYMVIHKNSSKWNYYMTDGPTDAVTAVSLRNNEDDWTDFYPGISIAQASLGAIIQMARERADLYYNQGALFDGTLPHAH